MAPHHYIRRVLTGRVDKVTRSLQSKFNNSVGFVQKSLNNGIKLTKFFNPLKIQSVSGNPQIAYAGKRAQLTVGECRITINGLDLFTSLTVSHRIGGRFHLNVHVPAHDAENYERVKITKKLNIGNITNVFEFGPHKKVEILVPNHLSGTGLRIDGPIFGNLVIEGLCSPPTPQYSHLIHNK